MKPWSIFLFLLLVTVSAQVTAEDYPYTSEGAVLKYHLAKDLTGYVVIKPCPKCKDRRHKITPDVKAILDNKEVPLRRFVLSKQKPNLLQFNKKTDELEGMIWFSKKKR